MKRTETYSGDIKPVRDGLYERQYGLTGKWFFDEFAGGKWCYCEGSWARGIECLIQERPWRGLTTKDGK